MSFPSIDALTGWERFSASHTALHKERHKAPAWYHHLLLKQSLILISQVHHRLHIDFIKGRQHLRHYAGLRADGARHWHAGRRWAPAFRASALGHQVTAMVDTGVAALTGAAVVSIAASTSSFVIRPPLPVP